jgi:leucyl/phenylalanyl-tRNA--protein transferase
LPYFELSKDKITFPPAYFGDIDGLVAVGGDMSIERLLLAYNSGIYYWHFPLKHIKWWSPDPRIVLMIDSFELSENRLDNLQDEFTVSINTNFEKVLRLCQQVYNVQDSMSNEWLSERAVRSFLEMHEKGFAHSVEIWKEDQLVGGLFGVAIGKLFFGEYLVSCVEKADELALLYLVVQLKKKEFELLDMQKETVFFEGVVFDEISRIEYVALCKENAKKYVNSIVEL